MRGFAGMALVAGLGLGACLIAETPGDPPKRDPRRPSIQKDRVSPPIFYAITEVTPGKELIVPVDSDPQYPLVVKMFLDFDPFTGGVPLFDETFPPDPTLAPTRIVHIGLSGLSNFDTSLCHMILVRVAREFSTTSIWTPIPPTESDDVVWFYRPNGSQAPCPGFDAGTFPEAGPTDAGTE